MIRPHGSVRSLRSNEGGSVVDDAHAERFRAWAELAPTCEATRRWAASSSASVSGPCSASHSATATSPSRTSSARRAARVIHAETLTPSAAAASTTRS